MNNNKLRTLEKEQLEINAEMKQTAYDENMAAYRYINGLDDHDEPSEQDDDDYSYENLSHSIFLDEIKDQYADFRDNTLRMTAKDIFAAAYEITAKTAIKEKLVNEDVMLSDEQETALMQSDNMLDEIYEDWLDKDTENLADIPDTITETADRLISKVSSKSQLIWRGFLAENRLDLNTVIINMGNSMDKDIFQLKEVDNDYAVYHINKNNSVETLTSVDELRSVYDNALNKYSKAMINSGEKEYTNVLIGIPNVRTPIADFKDFCPDWRERGSTPSYVKEVWDNFLKDHDLPEDTTKISFHATSTYYVGGIDENGHERKDNYSEYTEDDSFYLFDYDNELVIRYGFESELDFPIEDTIIDPSILSKDYEDVLEKYSTELSKRTYNYIDVCITKSDGSETHEDFESFCPDWEERAPIITSSRQR